MRCERLAFGFAAVALVNGTAPPTMAASAMSVAVCGSSRSLSIPLRKAPSRGRDTPCQQSCHAGEDRRKRQGPR